MNKEKKNLNEILFQYNRLIFMGVVIVVMTIVRGSMFFSASNFSNILYSAAIYGVMSCGMLFAALISGPDLSVGGMASVASMIVVMSMVRGNFSISSMLIGMLLAVCVGVIGGALAGAISDFLNVPSFLITLAFQYVLFGLSELGLQSKIWAATGNKVFNFIGTGRIFVFPVPVYIFLIVALLIWFVAEKTVFGRMVYAVGSNPRSSNLVGIPVRLIMISSFAISGLTAALGGVILAAQTQQGTPTAGTGYDSDVLLCVVIGGADFGHGIGSAFGCAYGAIFVALMTNGLRLLGVSSYGQTVIKGLIIMAVVAFERYSADKISGLDMRSARRKRKAA